MEPKRDRRATVEQLQELMGAVTQALILEVTKKRKRGQDLSAHICSVALDLLRYQDVSIPLDDATKTKLEKVGRGLLDHLEERLRSREITAAESRVLLRLLDENGVFVEKRMSGEEYLKLVSLPFQ